MKKLTIGIEYTDAFELLSVTKGDALSRLGVTETRDTNTVYLTFEGNEMDYNSGVFVTLSLKANATDEKVTNGIKVTVIEAETLNGTKADISDAIASFTILPYLPGDISGDGVTDLKDVTNLRRHLAGGYGVEVQTKAIDVNCDGKVDLKDVTHLRRAMAGGYGISLQ